MASMETVRDIQAAKSDAVALRRMSVEDLPAHIATLEAELREGGAIELTRGEVVVAELRAPKIAVELNSSGRAPLPDFGARLKELWGDTVLPSGTMTRVIREDRDGRG